MDDKIKKIIYLVLTLGVLVVFLAITLNAMSVKTEKAPKNEAVETTQVAPSEVKPLLSSEQETKYNEELTKYYQQIVEQRTEFNDNIQKLSNKKWLSHSFDDLVGISSEDMKIIQENNRIIYNLQPAYLASASIKVQMGDKNSARDYLGEYKKMVKSNKYIVQNDELLKVIDALYKKWGL